jgi:hypothetical protein
MIDLGHKRHGAPQIAIVRLISKDDIPRRHLELLAMCERFRDRKGFFTTALVGAAMRPKGSRC